MTFTLSFLMVGVSYLLLLFLGLSGEGSALSYLPWLLIAFSFPHFIATYAIWFSRIKSWKDEKWPIIFPFVYLAIFFLSIKRFIPFPPYLIVKLSYLYLIYHFCQQLYGVTLWMSGQKQMTLDPWEKRLLRALFLIMGLYALMEMELRGATEVLFYTQTPLISFPTDVIRFTLFSFSFLAIILVSVCFWRFFKERRIETLLPLFGVGAAFVWFIPPFSHQMALYLPIAHGLQYFPFIFMKTKHLSFVKKLALGVVSVSLGWILFRWLPFSGGVGEVSGVLWTSMILTLLNNHHFVIDGRIWKLSDPKNQDLFSTSAPGLQSPVTQGPA